LLSSDLYSKQKPSSCIADTGNRSNAAVLPALRRNMNGAHSYAAFRRTRNSVLSTASR
jgi:hypothetical protein